MTAEDVRQMVSEVEDKVKMLSEADPEAKATLFSALGIRLTYHDQQKVIAVESQPGSWPLNVSEGGLEVPLSRPRPEFQGLRAASDRRRLFG